MNLIQAIETKKKFQKKMPEDSIQLVPKYYTIDNGILVQQHWNGDIEPVKVTLNLLNDEYVLCDEEIPLSDKIISMLWFRENDVKTAVTKLKKRLCEKGYNMKALNGMLVEIFGEL